MKDSSVLTSPWAKTENEVLAALQVDPSQGLSSQEVKVRLNLFGTNVLKPEKKITFFQRIFSQFKNPVVIILLIAMAVTALLGEVVDSVAIAVIVIINARSRTRGLASALGANSTSVD